MFLLSMSTSLWAEINEDLRIFQCVPVIPITCDNMGTFKSLGCCLIRRGSVLVTYNEVETWLKQALLIIVLNAKFLESHEKGSSLVFI